VLCSACYAEKYPNITYDEEIVDNACMTLVKDPSKFDVLVMPNLYGDIVRSASRIPCTPGKRFLCCQLPTRRFPACKNMPTQAAWGFPVFTCFL